MLDVAADSAMLVWGTCILHFVFKGKYRAGSFNIIYVSQSADLSISIASINKKSSDWAENAPRGFANQSAYLLECMQCSFQFCLCLPFGQIEVKREFPFIHFGGQKGYEEAGNQSVGKLVTLICLELPVCLFLGACEMFLEFSFGLDVYFTRHTAWDQVRCHGYFINSEALSTTCNSWTQDMRIM